jgi:hypothetical protein
MLFQNYLLKGQIMSINYYFYKKNKNGIFKGY